jgi:fatty acid/phospholipid biosynthesis enzyme
MGRVEAWPMLRATKEANLAGRSSECNSHGDAGALTTIERMTMRATRGVTRPDLARQRRAPA